MKLEKWQAIPVVMEAILSTVEAGVSDIIGQGIHSTF